jgi:hypothetical protein
MSTTWRNKYFERVDCQGVAINEGTGDITIQGEVNTMSANPTIVYWAPNPPTYSTSYSGSALPYHDSIQAYDNTPNIGAVKAENRKFSFRVKYPNSYYVGLGSLYVPPHIHFKICEENDKKGLLNNVKMNVSEETNNRVNNNVTGQSENDGYHTIQIDEGIPFRTLTYPSPPSNNPRTSPMFYHCQRNNLPMRGQETILRDGGYPEVNVMPTNFWGLKPPN